jgi:hypothetical protein
VRFCRKSRPEILTCPIYLPKGKLENQQIKGEACRVIPHRLHWRRSFGTAI